MAKNEKPKSNIKIIVIIVLVLLLIGAAAFGALYLVKRYRAPYDSYQVVYSEKLVAGASAKYVPYQNGYLRVSSDGAEAIDSNGVRLWNISYSLNNPTVDVCGAYTAIGELGGKTLYITDGTGSVYKTEVSYKICEVECSENGIAAVRMNDDGYDYIVLINTAGEKVVEIKTIESKDGFPVDIDLSADAQKLVTSYLVVDGDEAGGWLTFYNFGSVGKNYSNNVTGIFKFEKVISQVRFIGSECLCAFFDDGISMYSVPELPSLTNEIKCEERILKVAVGKNRVAIMESGEAKGTVSHTSVYNSKGKKVFEGTSTDNFTGMLIYGDGILFYTNYACQILSDDGSVRFNGNFDGHSIEKLMSVNGKDKLLLFENGQVLTLQLTKSGATE